MAGRWIRGSDRASLMECTGDRVLRKSTGQDKIVPMSGKLTLAALLVGGLFMLAALQRQLIYFPEVVSERSLLESAQRMGLRAWRDSSGGLIGWRASRRSDAEHRVVVFHGNAGHALHRQYFAAGFLSRDDAWEICLFEYPGYGARPGPPSESAIKSAAADALEELLREDTQPLFLVGESLGSGVATDLAARFPAQTAGVLLVTPFTSLADVARRHYGYLPVDHHRAPRRRRRCAGADAHRRRQVAVLPDPGAAARGHRIVVSPLIALMQDQVDALRQLGVRAAFLNSSCPGRAQGGGARAGSTATSTCSTSPRSGC
jgi:pimeloyl-ACP methyl ester carboxylesterase